MARIDDDKRRLIRPSAAEVEEAKRYPGGWIYRIAGHFEPEENVPPEAIVGAWQINESGVIIGEFNSSPRYDSIKYPAIHNERDGGRVSRLLSE